MTNFIGNLLQISITMAAVIGLLLLLVPVWQKRYSAKWRKLIWLIIAVRLLVPFSIELPSAPVQMNVDMHEIVALSSQPVHTEQNTPIPAVPNKIETPSDIVVNTTVNTTTPTVTIEQGILLDRGTVLFAIWLLGLLAFTIYHIVQYRRFYDKIMASVKPLEDSDELLERAGADMGLQRYPAVLFSGKVQSPMLIGFRVPMIVLPYKLYGENELVMILRHELTHYKHHDLWYKFILLCANALHWFNPLVWMMNRQAGRDIEQVCDDYVVAGQDMDYRKAYSMTILNTMASQKGVALSTHLSKDAQNTKKRFAGILQPKTYKKGIAVFAAVLILAVGISGCLQIGKVDEGVALYNKVAEYLPENAIHNPEEYMVWGHEESDNISYRYGDLEKDESDYISYIWAEDLYEVTEEEFNQAGSLAGYRGTSKDKGYFLSKRSLEITILKETGHIEAISYGNTEERMEPVKPSEIGRNKEQRDVYVQQIAAEFLADGDSLVFREALTDIDENGNPTLGYYVCGTEADPNQYVILLDYTEGALKMLRWIRYDSEQWESVEIWRDFTFMLEGMEETVRLELNRQSGYYALYTDSSIFHRVPQEFNAEGAFLDRYVRRVEPNLVQCYIQVGYVPNKTIGEWLDEVETNEAYAQFRPQTNPLASYIATEWEPTAKYKVFSNEPNRQWREYITISGAYNVCYLTPYRDGVMIVQYSHPFGAEDFEGMGSRMAQMIDTLVLATEGEEYTAKKQNSGAADTDNGIVLYNQIAPFLPEHVVEYPAEYQRTRHTDYTEYVWGENPFAVYASSIIPPVYQEPYGLMVRTDNDTGEIINYRLWYDEKQITLPVVAESLDDIKVVSESLVNQLMQSIVPNGEKLSVKRGVVQPEYQPFTAIDAELHRKYQSPNSLSCF